MALQGMNHLAQMVYGEGQLFVFALVFAVVALLHFIHFVHREPAHGGAIVDPDVGG